MHIIEKYDTLPTCATGFKALPFIHAKQLYSASTSQAMKLDNSVFGDWSQDSGKLVCSGTLHKVANHWDMSHESITNV